MAHEITTGTILIKDGDTPARRTEVRKRALRAGLEARQGFRWVRTGPRDPENRMDILLFGRGN